MPSEMAEQRATCPPAVTLSEYTQPILLSQTLNPQPPRAFYQRPFNRLYASSQFPGTNLCRALTIQSIVTHQWNKDSFIAHNVRMACSAAKPCSAEQVVQEAREAFSPTTRAESTLLLLELFAIRK